MYDDMKMHISLFFIFLIFFENARMNA